MLSGQRDLIFDQIFFRLADNLFRHKIIDKFDFGLILALAELQVKRAAIKSWMMLCLSSELVPRLLNL